ncbi:MAG TPA: hypothetical protein DCX01_11000 [Bacteroidetes bacterium]|nr:hypothetical protein [Bacteroidota bacterium]
MKNLIMVTIMSLALFTMSCNDSSSHKDVAIELNNGERWKVNAEMTPFILEAENILNEYSDSDYEELAEQLEDQNKRLIKSCTMSGESHDELHKWLHPHMQLVKALDDAKNKEEAALIISDLKKSFQTYNTYFR